MEPCATYQPWNNKQTGKTYLRPDDGKCLHYYFSFIDEELGLSYVGVPTCLPCRLQIYCSGHNWLAGQLRKRNFDYRLLDNAFVEIGDWRPAQAIADGWRGKDRIARGEHTIGNGGRSPFLRRVGPGNFPSRGERRRL